MEAATQLKLPPSRSLPLADEEDEEDEEQAEDDDDDGENGDTQGTTTATELSSAEQANASETMAAPAVAGETAVKTTKESDA